MYDATHGLYVAHGSIGPISITGKMANRHGLIAGATGTGKTVTLQVLAESFSQAGVPCFMADMKGDLSGISQAGRLSGFIEKRLPEFGIENPQFAGCPTRFYDVFGEQGHPMRTTISNMGPMLLSRLLGLNEVQSGVMDIIFRVADDRGLLLLDMKDLRAMLSYVSEHAEEYSRQYGNVSPSSVGAIQRSLLSLENQGAVDFFAEPSFDIQDLFAVEDGRGVMSVLAADKLMLNPKLYSTFLLWLLSDIYATLPEVGDLDLPKLVFFFDEAHTLFTDTAPALVSKIEQVVRLIRSKGVGVYFITQSPTDIPDSILGQLGNRVQHALRAYTPKDQKAVKAAAETFRANPAFKTDEAIMNLETGEALVSFLDAKGAPSVVERAKILFPLSQIGAITAGQRLDINNASPVGGKYDKVIDRESAFEILLADQQKAEEEQARQAEEVAKQKEEAARQKELEKQEKAAAKSASSKGSSKSGSSKKKSIAAAVAAAAASAAISSVTRSAGTAAANAITGKKKSKNSKSTAEKAISSATSSALRALTRSVLGSLIK
jgi:DNA helicase HerA-like ATPase